MCEITCHIRAKVDEASSTPINTQPPAQPCASELVHPLVTDLSTPQRNMTKRGGSEEELDEPVLSSVVPHLPVPQGVCRKPPLRKKKGPSPFHLRFGSVGLSEIENAEAHVVHTGEGGERELCGPLARRYRGYGIS